MEMISRETEALIVSAERMTDVMSRVSVNLDEALRSERLPAVIAATFKCGGCANAAACDQWIAGHEEGEGCAAPLFCPNAELFRSLRPISH
jgi:hypothetical protein